MNKNEKPVIVEELFEESIKNVWNAITNIEEMRLWFFENIPDFKPTIGFKTQFNVVSHNREFLHLWEIVEVIEKKKIVYNWKYDNYEGEALVSFELFEKGKSTKLVLTNKVIESFTDDIEEFKRESCVGGWNYFINDRLKAYLKNR